MKLLILGESRHGKDTAAEYLRDEYGLSFASSSETAAEAIKPILDLVNGEKTVAEHFKERNDGTNPQLWKRSIKLYNTPDRSALCRLILKNSDVYVGMRDFEEYEASGRLFVDELFIEADTRVGKVTGTLDIPYHGSCMHHVDNNGTLDDLHTQLDEWAFIVGLKRCTRP
jgi:hypothetical protein